mmetsp:Transcript_10731/g.18010  ORF Transcript_10731/g.18010 Transcript_10731/m.18010 type:complete len:168 (+) Transcript_10731:220-723(+)
MATTSFGAMRGLLNVKFFQTNFSAMEHRSDIKKDNKMKEFQRILKSLYENLIMLELYPRSQIDLQVFVLESDGSYKSAAFNAVSLALMNAGIAMKDYLVATTSGLINNVAVLDLIYTEEKKQNCEFVMACFSQSKNIAYLSLNCNKINAKDFKNLVEMSQGSCDQIS